MTVITNPPVPCIISLPDKVTRGDTFVIIGTLVWPWLPNTDAQPTLIEDHLFSAGFDMIKGGTAFALIADLTKGELAAINVLNDKQTTEKLGPNPFPNGIEFKLTITAQDTRFLIKVNDVTFTYNYVCELDKINKLEVKGDFNDLTLKSVEYPTFGVE